ncbi:hypothetical protein ZHAS_00015122 [Anopheles sinensis]|uniref:Uncharacterized protein n=1 Tax=Anopheles sinensis TaxID=74873 RepID=A0A084WA34_ANOSI|nr:hypothetical protein ZHAS_00015122 [Anopheles sinensis]
MNRCAIVLALSIISSVTLVMASGDPITITGNTFGDLVNVNVNVTANIENEINQDYVNILALLLSSTGDVELFRKLAGSLEPSTATSTETSNMKEADDHRKMNEDINIEQALKKLFPQLVKKQ